MWTDDTDSEDPTLRLSPPPFQFNFQVFCPWATKVDVLIHKFANPLTDPVLFPLVRAEGALWCGELDLPGRYHIFNFRCLSETRSIIAPFHGGYPPPEIYAKLTARATYHGRRSTGQSCG